MRGEFAENAHRKDFTLSEAVAIKRALEPIERAAAKERQGTRTDKHLGKLPTSSTGRAADKVAKATGMARRTLEKAEAIVDAAEAEPRKFGKLLGDMDRTGRVNGVFKRLKIAKQAELIRAEPPPLPGNGPYRVVVVDPPWPEQESRRRPVASRHGSVPDDDDRRNLRAAGARRSCTTTASCGSGPRISTCARRSPCSTPGASSPRQSSRGSSASYRARRLAARADRTLSSWPCAASPIVTLTNQTTLLHAPVRGHSVKPVEFYDLVESLCPAPRYADLFSRYRHNERWDCHGDEAPAKPAESDPPEPAPAPPPPREAAPKPREAPPDPWAGLEIPEWMRRTRTTGGAS